MSTTVPAPSLPRPGSLDTLVESGRAIGVRVVLDLTCGKGSGSAPDRSTAALVVIPVEALDLIDDLPSYGC